MEKRNEKEVEKILGEISETEILGVDKRTGKPTITRRHINPSKLAEYLYYLSIK